jgi:hypothetical protein
MFLGGGVEPWWECKVGPNRPFRLLCHKVLCFQLRTTLNRMNFKFVSHGLWSEEQNILLQHMHKKEFWILTHKCGNQLKHENEVKGPGQFPIINSQEKKSCASQRYFNFVISQYLIYAPLSIFYASLHSALC